MNNYYVYEYYIKDTDEVFYVGKGKNKRYKDMSNRNKFFKDMYNSHKCSVRKVYNNLSEYDAFEKEKELINYYKTNTSFRLTNQTEGGEGISGFKLSNGTKLKISKANKLKWQDKDFKDKQAFHRQYGVYKSEQFRKKMSQVTAGKNNGNYKNYWTEQQKQDLSELRIKNGKSSGVKNSRATRIICIETGVKYDYIGLAMNAYNIKDSSIFSIALKNKSRTAAGLHWAYINDMNESYFNEEKNRRQYLIEALLLNKNSIPIICLETDELFYSKSELANNIKVTTMQISYQLKKHKYFIKNDHTYILLSDYNSRIQQ